MVKGTNEEVLAFIIKQLERDYGISKKDFPIKWTEELRHSEGNQEILDKTYYRTANTYEEAVDISEVSTEDFIDLVDSSDLDFVQTKGKQWVIDHMDDWFDILKEDGTCAKSHIY